MGQREIMPYETTVKRKNGIRTAPMCRLDVEQPEDVLNSSRCTVGRGVKRKLGDCEDLGSGLPYPQQRQLVLDLCLDKLQSCQRRAEPSLRRSVLLANTLRQIQQEMKREGGPPPPLETPPAPSPLRASTPCPSPAPDSSPSLPPAPYGEDDPRSARAERDLPAPAAPSEAEGRSSDSLFGSFEISNSTSYLTDLQLDDIFEDIDTSMYDPTDFSALACPASRGGAAAWPGADDGLKAFSSYTSSSTLQRRFMDLNDLDHIMEILVHS